MYVFWKNIYTKNLKTVTWSIKAMMDFTGEKLYLRFFLSQNSQFFIHRPPSSGLNVLADIFFSRCGRNIGYYTRHFSWNDFLLVFCYQNCSDLLWENIVLVIEKNCKIFENTKTIYSNSERSEQFLVTECFLTSSWRFLRSNKLEQLEFILEKILGFRNMQEKLENVIFKMGF